MYDCSACAPHACLVPAEARRKCWVSGTGITGNSELLCGCWESNQSCRIAASAAEPSLQTPKWFLNTRHWLCGKVAPQRQKRKQAYIQQCSTYSLSGVQGKEAHMNTGNLPGWKKQSPQAKLVGSW